MSELRFTPGPWVAQADPNGRPDDWVVGIGEAAPIDYVATCSKRDASLIEAAPDLLAALQGLVEVDGRYTGIPDDDAATWCAAIDKARAAIARATGGVA